MEETGVACEVTQPQPVSAEWQIKTDKELFGSKFTDCFNIGGLAVNA